MFELIRCLQAEAAALSDLAAKQPSLPADIMEEANKIGKSWSQSWLGYHADVYYRGFTSPPPGAVFSKEWGLMERVSRLGSKGDWVIVDRNQLLEHIYGRARASDLDDLRKLCADATRELDDRKSAIISLVEANHLSEMDDYSNKLCESISNIDTIAAAEVVKCLSPSGQQMSRDIDAINAGLWTPAHIEAYSVALSLVSPYEKAEELGIHVRRLAQHLENKQRASIQSGGTGVNVFIGHGRSPQWRELKDFISERLSLPVDEFNRVPVAGITNIQRLQQMLDQAAIAFLIMTAEDESSEGQLRARQNVIHEVGLFQGKLGFTKAIVLLEEGCEEFSNIAGLGQIRYPRERISAIFEQVREVLEREGVIEK